LHIDCSDHSQLPETPTNPEKNEHQRTKTHLVCPFGGHLEMEIVIFTNKDSSGVFLFLWTAELEYGAMNVGHEYG